MRKALGGVNQLGWKFVRMRDIAHPSIVSRLLFFRAPLGTFLIERSVTSALFSVNKKPPRFNSRIVRSLNLGRWVGWERNYFFFFFSLFLIRLTADLITSSGISSKVGVFERNPHASTAAQIMR